MIKIIKKQLQKSDGYSLLEVMLAVFMLSLILLPTMYFLVNSTLITNESRKNSQALWFARRIMEDVKALPGAADEYNSIPGEENHTFNDVKRDMKAHWDGGNWKGQGGVKAPGDDDSDGSYFGFPDWYEYDCNLDFKEYRNSPGLWLATVEISWINNHNERDSVKLSTLISNR